jgi:hypothetical protein
MYYIIHLNVNALQKKVIITHLVFHLYYFIYFFQNSFFKLNINFITNASKFITLYKTPIWSITV